jgi:hypothetical protein
MTIEDIKLGIELNGAEETFKRIVSIVEGDNEERRKMYERHADILSENLTLKAELQICKLRTK